MRTAAHKARPENGIGSIGENWLKEHVIILWIVFEVGILDQRDLARRSRESGPQRSALALVYPMKNDPIDLV